LKHIEGDGVANPWIAAAAALFVWWFSTGAILWVVQRSDRRGGHQASVLWGVPVLALGVAVLGWSLGEAGLVGVYAAFLAALTVWGWIELAFLSGVVTGPNRVPCPPDTPEWERFLRAWGTVAHHEVLLLLSVVLIGVASQDAANPFGFYTFALLYGARISAKLNLFMGVPKINTGFLPLPLFHLPSHFRIARMNWLFPLSVTGLTLAVACWLERLWAAATPAEVAGFALLTALTALATLEHWLMVLPLPDEKLWRWAMPPAPKSQAKTRLSEDAHGL
jgi:putative photosynthetic complex assembly protein 2